MPLKTRGRKGGRRGRPRKYPAPTESQTLDVNVQPDVSAAVRPTATTLHLGHQPDASKPREERSYKDFFPDLNIKESLTIVRIASRHLQKVPSTHSAPSLTPTPPPIPPPSTTEETTYAQSLSSLSSQHTHEDEGFVPTSRDEKEVEEASAKLSTERDVLQPPEIEKNGIKQNKTPSPPIQEEITLCSDLEAGSDLSSVSDIEDSEDETAAKHVPEDAECPPGELSTNSASKVQTDNTHLKAEPTKKALTDPSNMSHHPTADSQMESDNDISAPTPALSIKNSIPEATLQSAIDSEDEIMEDVSGAITGMDKESKLLSATESEDEVMEDAPSVESTQISTEESSMSHVIQHQKEGDTYQALSTRPQHHPPLSSLDSSTVDDVNSRALGVNLAMLPKPSFRKVTEEEDEDAEQIDETTEEEGRTRSVEARSFHRPENHYIRYIDPTEIELFDTVEYDMDEQDEAWLQMLNAERKKENLGEVSGDLFESIIDQLEKEWFDLIKNLPKQSNDEPSLPEDSTCAICDDGECENSNAIVFCDGCNLAVHQDCYGIPYIPEGQWLCRKCMVSPENPVSCLFCPNEGGAFKQTNTNKWGHLLCAIWIPEVGLSNSVYMEPIDNIENIPKSRWKLTCYICRKRQGACIQCDNKHCFVAFHVTCARWARLCMRMKSHSSHYDGVVLKAYCDKHTPRDYREQVDVEQNVLAAQAFFDANKSRKSIHRTPRRRYVENDMKDEGFSLQTFGSDDEDNHKKKKRRKYTRETEHGSHRHLSANAVTELLPSSKAARAHQHHYSAGAPIAPEHILVKLENLKCVRQAVDLRKKVQLVTSICRYWSLKRESRRGAPLLKRLHLEPWTASSSQHKQTEVEKAHRASAMMSLRTDLEKVRMLSEQVQKREKQKLERIRKQKAYLEMILFPIEYVVRPIVEQLMELDKKDIFKYPVTADVAPDYNEIIDNPMSFSDIFDQLAAHDYTKLEEFEADLALIWKNSMTYNKPDTSYYKLAQRLEKLSEELMVKAWEDFKGLAIRKETGTLAVDIHPEIFTYNTVLIPTPEELSAQKAEEERRRDAKAEAKLRAEARAAASEAKRKKAQERKEQQVNAKSVSIGVATRASRARIGSDTTPIATKEVAEEPTTQPSSKSNVRVRTRSMGSDGLTAPTADRLRKKNSSEARRLLWPPDEYNLGGSKSDASYKEDRSRRAPPGWVYLESEEEEEDKAGETEKKKKRESHSVAKQPLKEKSKSAAPTVSFSVDEIIWARVKGFPSHPAKIVDAGQEGVPERILKAKVHDHDLLVQFYEVPERHMW
ncbi:nuA3 HAT complex component nto1 [Apophysomyces sp. BC1021]|nr:nuA3 HAT complex component nto1 [Apophysomyces sp. BC1021]